jgi:hypothetical protein
MRHGPGLSSGMSRFPCGAGHLPGGGIRSKGSRAGLTHRDLTPHPSVGQFDSSARAVVRWLLLLKEVQHVHGTLGRPHCKKAMISVLQEPTAAHGNQPGISLLGEDHLSADLSNVVVLGMGVRRPHASAVSTGVQRVGKRRFCQIQRDSGERCRTPDGRRTLCVAVVDIGHNPDVTVRSRRYSFPGRDHGVYPRFTAGEYAELVEAAARAG